MQEAEKCLDISVLIRANPQGMTQINYMQSIQKVIGHLTSDASNPKSCWTFEFRCKQAQNRYALSSDALSPKVVGHLS